MERKCSGLCNYTLEKMIIILKLLMLLNLDEKATLMTMTTDFAQMWRVLLPSGVH